MREQRAAGRLVHCPKKIPHRRQLLCERRGGLGGELGGRRIDHRENRPDTLRKSLRECEFLLAPGQIGREQLVDIGINGEVMRHIDAGDGRQKN